MDLKIYFDILQRRFLIIIIVVATALSVLTLAGLIIPPVYMARATVRVLLDVGVTDFTLREDYVTRLLNTYTFIVRSEPVLREARNNLSPRADSLSLSDLRENIEVSVIPETELITIIVSNRDAVLAQDLANRLASLLIGHAQNLYVGSSKSTRQILEEQLAAMGNEIEQDRQRLTTLLSESAANEQIEALQKQIQFKEDSLDRLLDRYELARLNESLRANSITIVEPARAPSIPTNQLTLKDMALGLAVGVFGGVGLSLVLENLDTRIHSIQQLEHLIRMPFPVTVLGTVPSGLLTVKEFGDEPVSQLNGSLVEAYRLLEQNLLAEGKGKTTQTILVTSAVAEEGKSTVAANLARTFAERGVTIFLADVDLRRPSVGKMFHIDARIGLNDLLQNRQSITGDLLSQIIQPVESPSLFVIANSDAVSNPTYLLSAPMMASLVNNLKMQAQTTFLDAPPILGMADVSILAPLVDNIILVVRQGMTRREHLLSAIKQLQADRPRELGIVFVSKGSKDWEYQSSL